MVRDKDSARQGVTPLAGADAGSSAPRAPEPPSVPTTRAPEGPAAKLLDTGPLDTGAARLREALGTGLVSAELAELGQRLIGWFEPWGSCAVAFSAGIDSTLVALVAARTLGSRAIAVTADSPSLARHELAQARQLAEAIGLRHEVMATHELEREGYRANAGNRCYFCKDQLYTQLESLIAGWEVDVVVNGANRDDLGDHRPGMVAADEHRVRSPLIECGLGKAEVRELAAIWGLSNWDKPAAPCLASRVAYGVEVTAARLAMIEQGEAWLREAGFREFRLRLHADQLARVEVPLDELPRLVDPMVRDELVRHLQGLGFRYVTLDLLGFRSGNLNQLIQIAPSSPRGGL